MGQPTEDDILCQAPKPILLATGRVKFPYSWQPKIVPTQLFQIGNTVIAALPGEFTTMSGRRVRSSIRETFAQFHKSSEKEIILAGLSNIYTSYVTTPEEYEMQRYEAASTIYGPHTLTIYLKQFDILVQAMDKNISLHPGPMPPVLDTKVISLTPPVFYDNAPIGKTFGDVLKQPKESYGIGEQVHVRFISGNPRNGIHENTFFRIEKKLSDKWDVIANDADWETS